MILKKELQGEFGKHYVFQYKPKNPEYSCTCQSCKFQNFDGNSVHCYICDTCVLEYDHHCGVFGKCIGQNNLILFKAL